MRKKQIIGSAMFAATLLIFGVLEAGASGSYEAKVKGVREQFAAERVSLALSTDPGKLSTPENDLGQPDCQNAGGGSGGGGSSPSSAGKAVQVTSCTPSSKGAPVWTVNMVSLNFYMADTPLWYSSPVGPSMELKLSYNSLMPAVVFEPFGNKWRLDYGSFLYTMVDNLGLPSKIAVIMPDGKWDLYSLPDASGACAPPYHVFNTLTKISDTRFELKFRNGTVYVYDIPASTLSNASLLVEIRNAYGQKLSLGHDADAKLTTITDAFGKVTTLSYNAAGLVTQVTDPFGRFASFEYDIYKNLTKITDMGGYWTSFTYDPNFYLTGLTNGAGSWGFYFEPPDGAIILDPYPAPGTTMGWNSRFTVTNPSGGKEEYYKGFINNIYTAWHVSPKNYVPYVDATINNYASNPPKTTFRYYGTYGRRADVGTKTSPEGTVTNYSYDFGSSSNNTGNIASISVPGGAVSFTYNGMGQTTSVTDETVIIAGPPYHPVTNMNYAPNGVDLTSITDGLGTITRTYNGSHDITSITDRMNNTRTFTYDEYGQMTSETDELGTTTNYIYNADHLLTQVSRDSQILESYTHDAIGRIRTYTDSAGIMLTYDYNNLDDIVKIAYPDGKHIGLAYSDNFPHLITSITDRSGLTTQYSYSASKQLTQMVNPEGGITEFSYDGNGKMSQLTDPLSNATGFNYDNNNRLVQKTFADGTLTSFTYDIDGRIASYTNARNGSATYLYDGPDTISLISYSDPLTPGVINQHDQYHRLTTNNLDGSFSYDANSRLTSIDGILDADTLTFQYDAKGRKTGYVLQGGQTVSYTYDAFDRLTSLHNSAGTFSYSYSGANPLVQRLTRPNGSYTEYQYDNLKRLTGLTNRASAGTVINQYLYSYNDQDLRSSETITNGAPITAFQSESVTYSYNSVNKLLTSTNPSRTDYAYDADGNMTKGYVPGGFVFTGVYDVKNRLTSIQYEGTDLCPFTFNGITYQIPCPHTRKLAYHSDGMLAQVKREDDLTGEVVTNYVGSGTLPLQERDKNNNVMREYTWGLNLGGGIGGLLSLRQGGQDYYYLYDGKGNVTAVINSAQAVVATYAYDSFGKPMTKTGTLDQPYRFSTKPYDETMGLSYYGYRFYSPDISRWLTRDPLGEDGGFNLYGFVGNNPINGIDPMGQEPRTMIIYVSAEPGDKCDLGMELSFPKDEKEEAEKFLFEMTRFAESGGWWSLNKYLYAISDWWTTRQPWNPENAKPLYIPGVCKCAR